MPNFHLHGCAAYFHNTHSRTGAYDKHLKQYITPVHWCGYNSLSSRGRVLQKGEFFHVKTPQLDAVSCHTQNKLYIRNSLESLLLDVTRSQMKRTVDCKIKLDYRRLAMTETPTGDCLSVSDEGSDIFLGL